jgi:transposase
MARSAGTRPGRAGDRSIADDLSRQGTTGGAAVVKIGELMMILDLHRQGLSVAAIARETGKDAKTIRRYIAHGLEPPVYGPRPPQACRLDPYKAYLQERITAYPQLSGRRLLREVRDLGYDGGYTAITDFLRTVRPLATLPFEVRFETPPGRQAQGDFDQCQVVFTDEPAVTRIVWPPTVSHSARQLRGS